MTTKFRDRIEAGQLLATRLLQYADRSDVLILALLRGGVPVAFEIARALRVPLDVLVVRKLGVPGHEELAMGAIGSGGGRVLNEEVIRSVGIPDAVIEDVAMREQRELERRVLAYRGRAAAPDLLAKTVILCDDGIATGATMRVAIAAVRQQRPARIIVAVPAAAPSICCDLEKDGVEVIALMMPEPFIAVGRCYEEFGQTTDEEVHDLLGQQPVI
jgi:putative phosphoribosyl transferase